MVSARLEAAHFSHCGADAERKRVLDKDPEGNTFVMMRAKGEQGIMCMNVHVECLGTYTPLSEKCDGVWLALLATVALGVHG